MAYLNTSRASGATFFDRLADMAVEIKTDYAKWRMYRRTLTELRALPARELADLGMHRSMIKRVALEAAYGKAPLV